MKISSDNPNNENSDESPDHLSDAEETSKPVSLVMNYTIDADRNLSRILDGQKIFIQKLQRSIHRMVEYNGFAYYVDVFGDCFVIRESPVFLFGIMTKPLYFAVANERVYTVDKYARVWMHALDGRIREIAFIGEGILDAHISEEYCALVTDGEECVVEYRAPKEQQERKLMMFDERFRHLETIEIEKFLGFEKSGAKYQSGARGAD